MKWITGPLMIVRFKGNSNATCKGEEIVLIFVKIYVIVKGLANGKSRTFSVSNNSHLKDGAPFLGTQDLSSNTSMF